MENLKISEPDHYNQCHRHHHCRHCRHLKLWLVRALEQGQPRAFNDRASIIPLWWLSSSSPSSSPWRWRWWSSSSKDQFDDCPLRLELSSCNPPSCWLLFKQFKPELFPPRFLKKWRVQESLFENWWVQRILQNLRFYRVLNTYQDIGSLTLRIVCYWSNKRKQSETAPSFTPPYNTLVKNYVLAQASMP